MPSPFEHVDAAAFIGSWPLVPYFSNSNPAVLPGTLLDKATILSARRESNLGFNVVGRSFKIWIDAVGPIIVTFSGSNPLTLDDVIAQINTGVNAVYGQVVAYRDNGFLRLRSALLGQNSYLKIDTDPASSPADVFFELGLFAGLESKGGQVATAPTIDPDRQASLPGQYSVAFGEDLSYLTINRSLFQLAINADQAYGYWRRGVAKTTAKDVAISSDEFELTGEDVFCGAGTPGQPQDDVILILDQSGNEVVTERAVDLNTSLALDFWFDTNEQRQYVEATAATPFVAGDETGDFYVVPPSGAPFGTLEQLKIIEVLSTSLVVVMNVDPDGNEVEVGTPGAKASISTGIRRRVDTDRLHVTDFLDAPAGSSVINQSVVQSADAIDRVERNNRIFCDTATFVTDGVQVGDQVVISGHDTNVPYSNDGTYRVLQVIDEKTLELMTNEHGPVVLNPINVVTYGTATVQTDSNFYYEPYVKLSFTPPSDTYRVVFKDRTDLLSLLDTVDSFAQAPSSYAKEASFDIQRVVKAIIGPSVTSFDQYLYDDKRNSLENLDFRLNQEHDEFGRHSQVRADDLLLESAAPLIRFQDTGSSAYSLISGNSAAGSLFFQADVADAEASTKIGFDIDGSRLVTILDTGLVGIGTDAPGKLLHVQISAAGGTPSGNTPLLIERNGHCNLQIMANAANTSSVEFTNGADTNPGKIIYDHASNEMQFSTAGVNHLTLSSAGRMNLLADQSLGETADDETIVARFQDSFLDGTNQHNFYVKTRRLGTAAGQLWYRSAVRLERNIDDHALARSWMEFRSPVDTTGDNAIAFGEGSGGSNEWMEIRNGQLALGPDTDVSATIGRVKIGAPFTDWAAFSHLDYFNITDYGLLQVADGRTFMNCPTGSSLNFRINNAQIGNWSATGLVVGALGAALADLHVYGGNATHIWIEDTTAGNDAFTNDISGLQLSTGSMGTTSKYTPAVKFMSTDGSLTTENPKLLALMVGRSTEVYDGDGKGGMAIDFAVSGNNPGASSVPSVAMTIDQSGYVGIGEIDPILPLHVVSDGSYPLRLEWDASNFASIGPANSNFCHFALVGIDKFYFSDRIVVDTGAIGSFDEDLTLEAPYTAARMTISQATGFVGINATAPVAPLHVRSEINQSPALMLECYRVGTLGGPYLDFTVVEGLTPGVTNYVEDNDELGAIRFRASDSSNGDGDYYTGALIMSQADGAHASGSSPGDLTFWTTPSGSTTPLERMRIDADGNIFFSGAGGGASTFKSLTISDTTEAFVEWDDQTTGSKFWWVNTSDAMSLWWNDGSGTSRLTEFIKVYSGNIDFTGNIDYTGTLGKLDATVDDFSFGNTVHNVTLRVNGTVLEVDPLTVRSGGVRIYGFAGIGVAPNASYDLTTGTMLATTVNASTGINVTGGSIAVTGAGGITVQNGDVTLTNGSFTANNGECEFSTLTVDDLTVNNAVTEWPIVAPAAHTNSPYVSLTDNRSGVPPVGDRSSIIWHDASTPAMKFGIGSTPGTEFMSCSVLSGGADTLSIGQNCNDMLIEAPIVWDEDGRVVIGGGSNNYDAGTKLYSQTSTAAALPSPSSFHGFATDGSVDPVALPLNTASEVFLNLRASGLSGPFIRNASGLPWSGTPHFGVCSVLYPHSSVLTGSSAGFFWCQSTVNNTSAVYAYHEAGTIPVNSSAYLYGVQAYALTNWSSGGSPINYALYGYASGSQTNYGLYVAMGTKSWANPHPEDPEKQIVYVTLEGGENGTYWRGKGELKNGRAEVVLPDHFRCASAEEEVDVVVSPLSPDSQGLAVVESSNAGFVVEELRGGQGNYKFSYIIMGLRRGYEEHRAVVENNDYVPGRGPHSKVKKATQGWYDRHSEGVKKIFISNGTLLPDGKINEPLFKKMGWPIRE